MILPTVWSVSSFCRPAAERLYLQAVQAVPADLVGPAVLVLAAVLAEVL